MVDRFEPKRDLKLPFKIFENNRKRSFVKPKEYKTIDKSSFPACCIVCKHMDMESYWEFFCDHPSAKPANPWRPSPDVDFNGLCKNFERVEGE